MLTTLKAPLFLQGSVLYNTAPSYAAQPNGAGTEYPNLNAQPYAYLCIYTDQPCKIVLAKGFTFYHKGGTVVLLNYWGSTRIDIYNDQGSGTKLNYWILASDKWLEFYESVKQVNITENVQPRLLTSLNRTGKVFFVEDFSNITSTGERWQQSSGTIALTQTYTLNSKYALKCTTPATAGSGAEARLILPRQNGRIGFEAWFNSGDGVANIRYIYASLQDYDGATRKWANIYWQGTVNAVTKKAWAYYNSAGAYEDITSGAEDLNVESAAQPWYHYIKFVADFPLSTIVSLKTDTLSLTPNVTMYSSANATQPCLQVKVGIVPETATAINLYVHQINLTREEP